MNQVLADGFATGSIVDAKSFELYVALATVRSTQVARPGHSSSFELWCGQPANTLIRLAVYKAKDEEIEMLDTSDEKYVKQVSKQIEQLLSYEMVLRDETARRNNLRRDKMNGQFVLATQFDPKIGDLVSYDGTKWKLTAVDGPVGSPAVAHLTSESGKEKNVRYGFLKPLGVTRPVNMQKQARTSTG